MCPLNKYIVLAFVILIGSLNIISTEDTETSPVEKNGNDTEEKSLDLMEDDMTLDNSTMFNATMVNGTMSNETMDEYMDVDTMNITLVSSGNDTDVVIDVDIDSSEEEEDDKLDESTHASNQTSSKNSSCEVSEALSFIAETIKDLTNEIQDLKLKIFEKCPGLSDNSTSTVDKTIDMEGAANGTSDETELEESGEDSSQEEEDGLPPIPTECDAPFKLVASSCYFFLYYPNDWKNWGDANAYCQNLGGTLAAPYRPQHLRTYLTENFSMVFWVGAKLVPKYSDYEWLNGEMMNEEDWKEGYPSKGAAKNCVYLESFSGYKSINYYCGEKFSFVCEKRAE